MNLMELLDVNWLAVVGAALMGFVVGGIWYGPIIGKRWMVAVGLTEEEVASANMPLVYGGAFGFSVLASWVLAHTYATYGVDLSALVKVEIAIGVAIGFIIPAIGTNYLFSQKGKALFFIDAVYWLLFYLAMGCVHAFVPDVMA